MKRDCCRECLFEAHEPICCVGTQLRWDMEELCAENRLVAYLLGFEGFSECDYFTEKEVNEG